MFRGKGWWAQNRLIQRDSQRGILVHKVEEACKEGRDTIYLNFAIPEELLRSLKDTDKLCFLPLGDDIYRFGDCPLKS